MEYSNMIWGGQKFSYIETNLTHLSTSFSTQGRPTHSDR